MPRARWPIIKTVNLKAIGNYVNFFIGHEEFRYKSKHYVEIITVVDPYSFLEITC